MQRPVLFRSASGYTLVEILVSTALSLILLGAVVRMFGDVGQGITNSRAMLEAADRLRLTAARLQQDLAGITVPLNVSPPHKPENNEGYFEYIEGPVGTTINTAGTVMIPPSSAARNTDLNPVADDTSVGDTDDILMFTTRSTGQPFVGKFVNGANGVAQSYVAEVAWFVRGRTLYRRQLLVLPGANLTTPNTATYANTDISMAIPVGGGNLVTNTLGDLTKRENRFAHQTNSFPYSPYVTTALWSNGSNWSVLRLPTLCECSSANHPWNTGGTLPDNSTIAFTLMPGFTTIGQFDAWRNPLPYQISSANTSPAFDIATGALYYYYTAGAPTSGQRVADDVILTNVIGFDVKAWDPTYPLANGGSGAYVDLGYNNATYAATLSAGLSHLGHPKSQLNAADQYHPRVYDTYSFHYENQDIAGAGTAGRATNGFDDPDISVSGGTFNIGSTDGVVDNIVYNGDPTTGENMTAPPYPIPLRGIQVKIRIFEPDSRQIREVTVVQDFLSQ